MKRDEWAKREIEIVYELGGEDSDYKKKLISYKIACKLFKLLRKNKNVGFNIGLVLDILNRLIYIKPLTPIEDIDDNWTMVLHNEEDGKDIYQCTRMSSFFKEVYDCGLVLYDDVDRFVIEDISMNPDYIIRFDCLSLIRNIINGMFPIDMPYYPSDKPIKVYREVFYVGSTIDTMGVLYAIKDEERVEINRYFKYIQETHSWKEISTEEYEERKIIKS